MCGDFVSCFILFCESAKPRLHLEEPTPPRPQEPAHVLPRAREGRGFKSQTIERSAALHSQTPYGSYAHVKQRGGSLDFEGRSCA